MNKETHWAENTNLATVPWERRDGLSSWRFISQEDCIMVSLSTLPNQSLKLTGDSAEFA